MRLEWRTNRADRSAAVVCLASGIIIISWEADAGNSVSWLGVYLYIENVPETERWILLNKIVAPCLSSGIALLFREISVVLVILWGFAAGKQKNGRSATADDRQGPWLD